MRRFLMMALAATALAGCANIIAEPYQQVRIVTPGAEGADCTLRNRHVQYRVITPATLNVDRAPDRLFITCEKTYYKMGELSVEPKTKLWPTALNVTNGLVPGVSYDVASNSIYAYPDTINIDMEWDETAWNNAHDDFAEPKSEVKRKVVPEPVVPEVEITPESDRTFEQSLRK